MSLAVSGSLHVLERSAGRAAAIGGAHSTFNTAQKSLWNFVMSVKLQKTVSIS
jgi:hypothetical protein